MRRGGWWRCGGRKRSEYFAGNPYVERNRLKHALKLARYIGLPKRIHGPIVSIQLPCQGCHTNAGVPVADSLTTLSGVVTAGETAII